MLQNKTNLPNWGDKVILVHASLRSEDQIIDDIRFWQNQDEQTRSAAAWQLAKEVYRLRGISEDELRMDKSKGQVMRRYESEEPFDSSKDFVFTLLKNRRN
jgi:hypothetical protein